MGHHWGGGGMGLPARPQPLLGRAHGSRRSGLRPTCKSRWSLSIRQVSDHRGRVGLALHDVSTQARHHQDHLHLHRTRVQPVPPPPTRLAMLAPLVWPLFLSNLVKSLFCNELRLLIKETS